MNTYHINHPIDECRQSAVEENAGDSAEDGNAREHYANDIEDNHNPADCLHCAFCICDIAWPVDVIQSDTRREVLFHELCRLEVESQTRVRAICHILSGIVSRGIGLERARAKVCDMHIEEIGEIQQRSDIDRKIVDDVVDALLNVVA